MRRGVLLAQQCSFTLDIASIESYRQQEEEEEVYREQNLVEYYDIAGQMGPYGAVQDRRLEGSEQYHEAVEAARQGRAVTELPPGGMVTNACLTRITKGRMPVSI